MIGALFTGPAVQGGLKLTRGLVIGLVIGGLFAAGGLGFWRGMAAIERMVETARVEAIDKRDAHWRGEIAQSNAVAEAERARQSIAAATSSAVAERTISDLTKSLSEWETRHARSGTDQGCIEPSRVDALNRLRGQRTGGP